MEEWAKEIIARGPRPEFEMEQVLPGEYPQDWYSDLIIEPVDLANAGDRRGARRMLMEMLESDLRCLDAYAHLSNRIFDS